MSQSVDLKYPIDLNFKFWVLVYVPLMNSQKKFKIIQGSEIVEDSYNFLSRGSSVSLKYGSLSIYARIVSISEELDELRDEFSFLVTRFQEDFLENQENKDEQSATNRVQNLRNIDPPSTSDDISKEKYPEGKYHFATKVSKKKLEKIIKPFGSLSVHSPHPRKCQAYDKMDINKNVVIENGMVTIGTNGSKIPEHLYHDAGIWKNYTRATRKLMYFLFTRETLGTHSLTGNSSPAFRDVNKQAKPRLNPDIVEDVISIVCMKTKVSPTLVRRAITSICGDNSKQSPKLQYPGEKKKQKCGEKITNSANIEY